MKLKKYIGDTMPEIMQKIRSELGPDAVILNTKEIKHGGIFGFFAKKKLEVVAALDPEPLQEQQTQQRQPLIPMSIQEHHPIPSELDEESILHEIHQLKKMIQTQGNNDSDISPSYRFLFDYLKEQEVEEELAKKLIQALKEKIQIDDNELAAEQIVNQFKQYITHLLNNQLKNGVQHHARVIHFVGPTGVGKTTTLAKVAANSILEKDKKVAFITTDTYRIAAIDQLKTYAKILNVPLEVAYTKEDYENAIKKFAEYDLVYVDTAGRNFRDESYIRDLKETIKLSDQSETYLVLSLTAKQKDIVDIFNEFQLLNVKNVIFTKADETTQYGSILNISLNNDVNIAYLTNGQDVPNDLIIPTSEEITNLLMGDYPYG